MENNIHVIQTDKPSRLWINNLLQGKLELNKESLPFNTSQHLYITSDEEIKDGDYYLYLKNNSIQQFVKKHHIKLLDLNIQKKIILTTDQDLIADGIQAIDDNFLEWFVKNPNCEEVGIVEDKKLSSKSIYDAVEGDLVYSHHGYGGIINSLSNDVRVGIDNYIETAITSETGWETLDINNYKIYDKCYKIIIPKEEPKHFIDDEVECNMCGNIMSLLEDKSIYVCFNSECTRCYEEYEKEPKQDYNGVHLKHCYQGEYEDGCKYGEDDCSAKPLEEPKQELERGITITHVGKQETLEETAEKLVPEASCELNNSEASYWQQGWISGHTKGAKWQQERMYSEEDMRKAIQETITLMRYKATEFRGHENTILKQFKKK